MLISSAVVITLVIYVYQSIIFYILNMYSFICQLYFRKPWGEECRVPQGVPQPHRLPSRSLLSPFPRDLCLPITPRVCWCVGEGDIFRVRNRVLLCPGPRSGLAIPAIDGSPLQRKRKVFSG